MYGSVFSEETMDKEEVDARTLRTCSSCYPYSTSDQDAHVWHLIQKSKPDVRKRYKLAIIPEFWLTN